MRNSSFILVRVLLCALLMSLPVAVSAAEILVNTTDDELNADGDCALREAVQAINMGAPVDACAAGDGNDTISFSQMLTGQTIVLNLAGPGENNNNTGDLDIFANTPGGSIVIAGPGPGPDSIIIDGGRMAGLAAPDRIFHIVGNTNTAVLEFSNLTLQNGAVGDPQTFQSAPGGGAIYAQYGLIGTLNRLGSLRLQNVVIQQNTAYGDFVSGGGVFVENIDTIDIDGSQFSANTLTAELNGAGGGFGVLQAGPVTITGSTFSDNRVVALSGNAIGGGFAAGNAEFFTDPNAGAGSINIVSSTFMLNSLDASAPPGSDFPAVAIGGGFAVSNVTGNLTVANSQFNQNMSDVESGNLPGRVTGGGFFAGNAGAASFDTTTFNQNIAVITDADGYGGGAYIESATTLSFEQGSVSNNRLTTVEGAQARGGDAQGGGLWVGAVNANVSIGGHQSVANELSVSGTVNANTGRAQGGGAYIGSAGSISIDASGYRTNEINASNSASGGGLWFGAANTTLAITGSEFSDNQITATSARGGGIYVGGAAGNVTGSFTVTASRFFANSLTANTDNAEGAGFWLSTAASLSIDASEFAENMAASQGIADVTFLPSALGAGLYINTPACPAGRACAQIRNTTVSGNSVTAANSRASGAGLYLFSDFPQQDSETRLNNVSIARNDANAASSNGGGFVAADRAILQISNSLVAENSAGSGPDCDTLASGGDNTIPGSIVSNGFNLIGNAGGCEFPAQPTDLVGGAGNPPPIDPLIGALGNNGGMTRTHALLLGSPAIDAGNPASPNGAGGTCETVDQRGAPRPRDGDDNGSAECDIGALERVANAPPTVINPIADISLQANDDSLSFDLTTVFSDPEAGQLTFNVVSSNPSSVIASINGAILTISPVADGIAIVDVTATDQLGASTTDSPTVRVGNRAPGIVSEIPDQTLSANGNISIDLNEFFQDPDGDPLLFNVVSSNPDVVAVSVDDQGVLLLTGGVPGTATITVTAQDAAGLQSRALRVRIADAGTDLSSGGGCVMNTQAGRMADPTLLLLVLVSMLRWFRTGGRSGRRSTQSSEL